MDSVSDTLCGVPWGPLLRKQPTQLTVQANVPWLLATQCYIAATLNWRRLESLETLALWTDPRSNTSIPLALLAIGASLERACDNMSQWSFADQSGRALDMVLLLDALNHGVAHSEAPPCDDEFDAIAISSALDTLYYINGNDRIVLRDPATNITSANSLLEGLYATQYGSYTLNALQFICMMLLGVKLVLVLHSQHQYQFNKRDADVPFVEPYDVTLTHQHPFNNIQDTELVGDEDISL